MTDSTRQSVRFPSSANRPVQVQFDEALGTSDGGGLLLSLADEIVGITETLSAVISDWREPGKIRHTLREVIQQRVFGLALGYADANDFSALSHDPMHKLLIGRDPLTGEALASQATISRFENSISRTDLMRAALAMTDTILAAIKRHHRRRPKLITIDLDPSDDPAHGSQQNIAFNSFYDCHCFLPLLAFVTIDDEPEQYALPALLRGGKASATEGAFWVLRQILGRLRKLFPKTRIRVRLDGGFSGPELLDFLDGERVEYLIGLAKNSTLSSHSLELAYAAWEGYYENSKTVTLYGETRYAAESWNDNQRRVIIKAEVVQYPERLPRENTRYVVTNLRHAPQRVYEIYRQRGDVENRIKELFLEMELGRTSCSRFEANQLRMLLTVGAYALLQEIRRCAAPLFPGRPQVGRLRLLLLKIGGRIQSSLRRIVLHLAEQHPARCQWQLVVHRLGRCVT